MVSNEATVTVKIICKEEGSANPDYRQTNEDEPVTEAVLENDDDEDDPISLTSITQPSIGATQNPDGTITYSPELCNDSEREEGSYTVVIPYSIEDADDE